jgi:hypothetical protein
VEAKEQATTEDLYLNHSDSAKYVGMQACRQCHESVYKTFIETGMGKSFNTATRAKSSAGFRHAEIYDKYTGFHYKAFWQQDSMYISEFRLNHKDTVHRRTEQVNFIIGSGQHTNSHLQSVNGYVNQMPMTFYTQKKRWDLPPGFENGINTRFSRKIGLECMSCHNAFPGFVMGSENKFTSLPPGINCERCHGPGSVHVFERTHNSPVDTARYIDYSIVNPAKLPVEAQFDICQRCHLQGNAVLKNGKSFFDFKPGQKLSDFISVFVPKYDHAENEFIMASHVERLKQSPCFIKSLEKVKGNQSLKPYKDAMTCVTCHNPHVSVRATQNNVFNNACLNCHNNPSRTTESRDLATAHKLIRSDWRNCVGCHMPLSDASDIPHVSVHDHYIRKPVSKPEKERIRKFAGLYSVNEKNPGSITRATAYVEQFSKFEQLPEYLDSAMAILQHEQSSRARFQLLVQVHFIRKEYAKVVELVKDLGEKYLYDSLLCRQSYDNRHAWSAYHIGEAYTNTNNPGKALKWYKRAALLAPFNLGFRNKYGSALVSANDLQGGAREFEYIISENPKFVPAYSNLGYIKLLQGLHAEAKRLYSIGTGLDPDNEQLLLNVAGYHLYMNDKSSAIAQLKEILKKYPGSEQAGSVLRRLTK